MTWFQDLQRDLRQKRPGRQPTKPTKALSVGFVGAHPGHSQEITGDDPSRQAKARLVDFFQLVRSAGVDHGVFLDAGAVDKWLPGSDRESLCTGQFDRTELSAMAQQLALRMVTARGLVPDNWTDISICDECGPVFAAIGSDTNVSTCIWCDIRRAKRWFPRPLMQCSQCSHLTRDKINPAGGLGSCGKGHDSEWLCFPHSRRPCADWRESLHKKQNV